MTHNIDRSNEGKKWPQFLATLIGALCALTSCLNTGWATPFLPKILSDEYPFDISNSEASYITIIAPFGMIFGGFFSAFCADAAGRRRTIFLTALLQFSSFCFISLSYYAKELLYVARFIGGVGDGMTFSVIPIYIAEIAEADVRGTLGTMTTVMSMFGFLTVNLIGSYLTIRLSAIIFMAFPVVFVVLFYKMPESPYWLLMKNRASDAESALKFLRRKRNVDDELKKLTQDVTRQMTESGTYRDLFSVDSNRKALFLTGVLRIVQQFTGATAFIQYLQILMKEATPSLAPHVSSSIIYIVQLCMVVASSFFIDRYGRKPLFLFSCVASFIDLFLSTLYFVFKEYTSYDVSSFDWLPLVLMVVFSVVFIMGLGAVTNIFISEMFSASVKTKAVCLTNVIFASSMMGSTKFYQVTADNYGLTVPYASFSFFTFLGILFLYFCLPETKGKTLEEIQQQLKFKRGTKNGEFVKK